MANIRIHSSAGKYEVQCQRGALKSAARPITRACGSGEAFILSSPHVWKYWSNAALRGIRPAHANRVILFDDAEPRKDMRNVEAICRALHRSGADRHSVLVAVGGGVVGDVAGYVAASYLRGVSLVHVPTTVVAQVDSSIGGKTGVNLPEGKNLVGAFYPPKLVLTDPDLLATLPHREFRSGLYEVIKSGVIADPCLFDFLERNMRAILRRDAAALAWIIPRCIQIKARVVTADERERGLRKILNFGHTLGHALESATAYRLFLHGEAIAWGMIAAAQMAVESARLRESQATRIIRLILEVGPLPSLGRLQAGQLRKIMLGDKKSRAGRIRWVLPRRIGKANWDVEIPWAVVARVIRRLPQIAKDAR
ncbi:MAG TPA: 3-dehydroquinate synthase [Candidatus Acidoferrales bacterium]|nr:3-dehydroquinate synthase [Candidatus Acidoferrales bacterium]